MRTYYRADNIVACVGGGSNAAGAFYHYLNKEVNANQLVGSLGLKSGKSATTALQEGIFTLAKILMRSTFGFCGLDYPTSLHSHLFHSGRAKFYNVTDTEALKAGYFLSRLEGIIQALESAHALAILEKINFKKKEKTVLILSGRGDKDLETYIKNQHV